MAYEAVRERAAEAAHTDRISAPLAELFATGRRVPEADYRAALTEIDAARRRLIAMLGEHEFILGPAALGAAPAGLDATGTPILSRPWQAMGLPVVTIPGHRDDAGLPLGLQLIGKPGDEQALLEAAAWLEGRLAEGCARREAPHNPYALRKRTRNLAMATPFARFRACCCEVEGDRIPSQHPHAQGAARTRAAPFSCSQPLVSQRNP